MNYFEELKKTFNDFASLPDEAFQDANIEMIKESIEESFSSDDFFTINLNSKEELEIFKANALNIFSALETLDNQQDLSSGKKEVLNFIYNKIYTAYESIVEKTQSSLPKVLYELTTGTKIPTYAHEGDVGADIYCPSTITIPAHSWGTIVPAGFKMVLPRGWEAQVRPRSGMSAKTPIRIANAPGTIEYTYRGEVGVIVDNIGNEDYTINEGDRFAQLVFHRVDCLDSEEIDSVDDYPTDRGEGGFGSSGR